MTYEEALAYIKERSRFGIKLGLERMRFLLGQINDPQMRYPVIHIAGTNGKGSTAAMIYAVLMEAGYKVGRFTSPHLSSYTERFSVNGRDISPERLAALITEIRPVLDQVASNPTYGEPTEFEVGTLLAMEYFAKEKVDLAIIEVGMGGRLDATNVVDPLISVITHLAMDHREYLGEDLASIAAEKAAIIKQSRPVISAPQEKEAEEVIRAFAARVKAPYYRVGEEIRFQSVSVDPIGASFFLKWQEEPAFPIHINLLGAHQVSNAATAFGALMVAKESGFDWSMEDLCKGFANLCWPGRLERLPGEPPILLDGAHNPDAAAVLSKALEQLFSDKKILAVVGILKNKAIKEIAAHLGPRVQKVIATTVPDPKSATPAEIAEAFSSYGKPVVEIPDALTALEYARTGAGDSELPDLLLITGSLYLVGSLRPRILQSQAPTNSGGGPLKGP